MKSCLVSQIFSVLCPALSSSTPIPVALDPHNLKKNKKTKTAEREKGRGREER